MVTGIHDTDDEHRPRSPLSQGFGLVPASGEDEAPLIGSPSVIGLIVAMLSSASSKRGLQFIASNVTVG
jgi:hypothetical protein